MVTRSRHGHVAQEERRLKDTWTTTPRGNPNVYGGFLGIMVCRCKFISCHKGTMLTRDGLRGDAKQMRG